MPTVQLSQIRGYVLDRLEGNTALYTNSQINAVINECYRITNAFCGINQTTTAVGGGTVANQLEYSIPSGILFPLTAWVGGVQLRKLSLGALARNYRNWATDTTRKLGGPPQRWAAIGISKFILHPIDSLGGRSLTITGVAEPTLLAADGDVISVEDEYLTMIVEYCAHRLQLKEGGKIFSDSSSLMQTFYSRLRDRMILTGVDFPNYKTFLGAAR